MNGFLTGQINYAHRIWQLRYFWFYLVRIDLSNRYKRSFFGIGWSLLRPLSMTLILCVMFGKLFNIPIEDYAPYLLIGQTVWQFFTESLNGGSGSFSTGSTFIRQEQVPLAIFPLRSVLGSGFHALVALSIAIAFTFFFRGCANPLALLYLLPAIVLLFFLGWFMATLAAIAQSFFPDTRNLIEIGLQLLYYITPILFRREEYEKRGYISIVLDLNPLTSVLALVRAPLMEGTAPAPYHIGISLLFLAVVGAFAVVMMRKTERSLIYWI